MLANTVSVECLKCGKRYAINQHPLGYICPDCGEILFRRVDGAEDETPVVRCKKPYPLCRLDDAQTMQLLVDSYASALAPFIADTRERYNIATAQTDRQIMETFFLINELDRRIGYAALNLLNLRVDIAKYSPQQLHGMFADTFAEVREIRRLKLDQSL